MRNARMLLVVALLVGTSPFARGEDHAGSGSGSDAAEQARRDRVRIAIQDICPVSGNKLGEHGEPVKVSIGQHNEEVFLCCKGCASGTIDPKHWATIHANFAKAQQICPVMKHKLPKNPKWTIVQGQVIYVCCPPCTKKIAASPDAYLKAIDQLYAASLNIQSTRR